MDGQEVIVFKRPSVAVDESVLPNIRSLGEALGKCVELSGMSEKAFCIDADIQPATWTRMKQNEAGVKRGELSRIMDVCGNELPLMWLNYDRGYEPLPPQRETELERENRELREKLRVAQEQSDAVAAFFRKAGIVGA